ncbi:hypothetical protein VNO77_30938 [Canavalia gladiata]|uniref:Uncharacterized protein n=1 Tax=Canavalia gladiata TaxID=3824 RepID=A0AAN9KNH5_CANGL
MEWWWGMIMCLDIDGKVLKLRVPEKGTCVHVLRNCQGILVSCWYTRRYSRVTKPPKAPYVAVYLQFWKWARLAMEWADP